MKNVDGQTDAGVTGILIAHLGAFGSGELKKGILILYQNRSVVHLSVTFLVIVSSPKLFDVATSNFAR